MSALGLRPTELSDAIDSSGRRIFSSLAGKICTDGNRHFGDVSHQIWWTRRRQPALPIMNEPRRHNDQGNNRRENRRWFATRASDPVARAWKLLPSKRWSHAAFRPSTGVTSRPVRQRPLPLEPVPVDRSDDRQLEPACVRRGRPVAQTHPEGIGPIDVWLIGSGDAQADTTTKAEPWVERTTDQVLLGTFK